MNDTGVLHLVEAALYVDDLDRAEAFYRDVLALEVIGKEPGRHVFFRAGEGVLLIFNPASTQKQEDSQHMGPRGQDMPLGHCGRLVGFLEEPPERARS